MSYLIIALIGGIVCGAIAPTRRRSVLGWPRETRKRVAQNPAADALLGRYGAL